MTWKAPLTPSLSRQTCLGEAAFQRGRTRLRVRQQKMQARLGVLARRRTELAPAKAGAEGELPEAIKRIWHHQSSESGSSVVLFTSEIAMEEFVNCTEAAWLRRLRKNAS
jgi:hypothetical protein